MKILSCILIAAALWASCTAIMAAPAPWFQWRSKIDGKLACSQTPLGKGWEKAAGPFRDSHCKTFLNGK